MSGRWGWQTEVAMKTLTVGELKARFADVLREVEGGEVVAVSYGRRRRKVAAIVRYDQYTGVRERNLGVLEGKAVYRIAPDFTVSDEELVGQ
jgi:antitoxin (DNA-binding transcriptional repressor) of toxin-antitoxin stability system